MSIMAEIVARREARIRDEGPTLGIAVPERRSTPLVPFGRSPFVICEIKRRSPSRGDISEALDAPAQARIYASRGARSLSVLTEEDHFNGSLADLMAVKAAQPQLSILRKDFLLSAEDIEISFRAGADAVLLIAGILQREELKRMYERAIALGLQCLVEVHSTEEIDKVRELRPAFTGINARDLTTFHVDLALPLTLRADIDWPTSLVFESGMHSREHAAYAAAAGFEGVLVGEAVVRRPELVGELIAGLADGPVGSSAATGASSDRPGPGNPDFWRRLYAGRRSGRPLVKVCGLTNREDALLADELGADLLGFVLAPSKRRADSEAVRSVGRTKAAKVGVVVLEQGQTLAPEVTRLLEEGSLDAIQFHGDEGPEECYRLAFPYYKAVQLRSRQDCDLTAAYRCPRVLVDAHVDGQRGGTGTRLADDIVTEAGRRGPLWLAGGIGAENAYEIITKHRPELIDASSALEAQPGKKDPARLRSLFREIERAQAATMDDR